MKSRSVELCCVIPICDYIMLIYSICLRGVITSIFVKYPILKVTSDLSKADLPLGHFLLKDHKSGINLSNRLKQEVP